MTTTVGRKGLDLFNSLLLGMGACSLLGYLLGWREAGSHQVTWDASGLPSGCTSAACRRENSRRSGK